MAEHELSPRCAFRGSTRYWLVVAAVVVALAAPALAHKGREIIDKIYFARSATDLPATSKLLLQSIANSIQTSGLEWVEVVGHADPKERDALGLAERRAGRVRAALTEAGAPVDRVRVRGAGPLCADPRNRSCAMLNRCVEFQVHWP